MQIRKAEEKDVGRILELLTQVNMVHHSGRPDLFRGPAQKYPRETLARMVRSDADPIFCAVDESDRVLGYVMCQSRQITDDPIRTPVRTLYIDDLCVDEALRGRHIGRALYHYARDYAKKNGYYNITLHVWACNEGAAHFYEMCGMKPQYTCLEDLL